MSAPDDGHPMRWSSALSSAPDFGDAVADCVATLVEELGGNEVDLVIAFVSEHYREHFDVVPRLIESGLSFGHLLGCSAHGVLAAGTEVEAEPGLALIAAVLPDVELHPFHIERGHRPIEDDPDAWSSLVGIEPGTTADFVVLCDPFSADPRPVIDALDRWWPQAVKVGGLASAGQRTIARNALFLDHDVFETGAIGLAITGNLTIDPIVAQGCRPIGDPMFITAKRENLILELDGRPAIHSLSELHAQLDKSERALLEHSLFIGVAMDGDRDSYEHGDFLVRNLVGAVSSSGALVVAADLADVRVVQFHLRDRRASSEDLVELLNRHRESGPAPRAAVLFSCLGRGSQLYDEPNHDSRRFLDAFGPIALSGFFCQGEIGPVHGRTWLHGYTSAFALFRPRET